MSFGTQKAFKAGTQSTISFNAPSSRLSEDELLVGAYETILARSYNLFRNSSIPAGISKTLTNYIGGRGLIPINIPIESKKLWLNWGGHSNISGTSSLGQDYRNIIAGQVESGDTLLTTITDRSIPQDFIRTKLHFISGSRVRTPGYLKDDSNKIIRLGVEFNRQGKELGYWVAKEDKKRGVQDSAEDFTFIPRRDKKTGRFISQLMRKPEKMTPGQTRGLPIITPIIQEMEDAASLWDSALKSADLTELMKVALEIENPEAFYGTANARNDEDTMIEVANKYGLTSPLGTLDPSSVKLLPPGTKPIPITHNGNMELDILFHRINLYIATALGIPYEILFKDFSKTNFSSGKIGLDSFYRMIDIWTEANSRTFTELFKLINREGVLKGLIPEQDISGLKWIGPARVDIDPGKNSKAESERLKNGLITQTELLADRGQTYEDHLKIKMLEEETRFLMGFDEETEEEEVKID